MQVESECTEKGFTCYAAGSGFYSAGGRGSENRSVFLTRKKVVDLDASRSTQKIRGWRKPGRMRPPGRIRSVRPDVVGPRRL